MGKSVLSNCLLQSIYYRIVNRGSKIKMYYNKKYGVISFYVITRDNIEIKFKRDKTKPIVIKYLLFYIQHTESKKENKQGS